MPCIHPDGTLTESARALLQLLDEPLMPQEIAARLERPVFWVRMSLRELVGAGLIRADGPRYLITEKGRERL